MKDVTMANLTPDLIVCSEDSANSAGCTAGVVIANRVPFILLSLGADGNEFVTTAQPNSDQGENSGEVAVIKNAAPGEDIAYLVGNDGIFVSKSYSSASSTAGQFDDLIIWVSPYILYNRLIEVGELP
jgi:hypothetical protein